MPLLRKKYRLDMEKEEARASVCVFCFIRIVGLSNCQGFQAGGVLVCDPYESNTYWDYEGFVTNEGQLVIFVVS